ncbi:MAG: anthranilate phosphoribosyltransferase [Phenylobacterium sp.]|jgi:anthranilate phosphoribosyltransferase|uniref:Anthranilate phosphoribosyltransferase n=1 Tax=Phenylobacterium ferrooxidans TaxID=2982689 RepID=A0ABW6CKZ6_9CAUL|nr:anthranilate phosphoribosyltransferase [Phenylobacterium sp.]MDO8322683.1 anthranilate phosphoribosyltransferase [Phenylobacterium sp.]MDO8911749.1 anthranilate phosphoribosyltransferase [Phenylobacterium sp.]MDP2009636.1 anthranilate phosphoribosyltransferase [Phenylobacterium sp.]MDP3099910.1 anthranilate phosphoribosyltransferase [Phenylobacterium sp.]MDP3868243.1 anthranilate phosphoribosyltransferase [Phenylobacterium sp.]
MSDAFKPLLGRLADGQTLSDEDAGEFFAACLRGEPSPAQVAAAITAMRLRGETVGEITACAKAMRRAAVTLDPPYAVMDVCGTGGDGLHTLNISTAVGFVAAGGGLKVAKHGNRALSSRSGTADVLTELGVDINAPVDRQMKALDEAGICFMFAQAHHGAMRHVSPIRAELGFRTVFNLLGPLTNPANAKRQVMGVFAERWVEPLARVLGALGSERAWVVHGGGMDEMTTTGESVVAEWRDGQARLFTITPEAVGLPRAALADLTGGSPAENAVALRALLDGETGAYRDIVLLNAAAAFLVGEKVETLRDGIDLARAVIDDGRAKTALTTLAAITSAP